MKKRRMHGGTALIDQPFSVRQATDSASNFFKDPMGTFGYGLNKRGRPRKHRLSHAGSSTRKMSGGTALIDQPFTVRQAYDTSSNFTKDPMGTLGFGLKKRGRPRKHKMHGGTALIDQPFTVRQATDSASHFFKDPMGTFGYGLKKKKVHHRKKRMSGKALYPAGY